MAITRAQQAKQMLQDGGMLVQPGFGGTRQGYRSAKARSNRTGGRRGNTGQASQSVSSFNDPSANRVAAATNIKSMQDAYGVSKKGLTEDQKRRRDDAKASRKKTIQALKPESGISKIIRKGGFIPTFLSSLTDSEFNKRRRANFMKDLTDLSERFQRPRNINLPFGIGSFDANARINNNLLQSLLNEAKEELGITTGTFQGPGPFNFKDLPISLSDLPKDKQNEIYDKVMDARMSGQTDAAGNLKSGFMFDARGNIIPTGNDGREDPILPIIPKAIKEEDTEEEYVNPLSLLTPRIAGSRMLGSQFAADGGRIGYQRGGRRGDTGQASYSVSDSFTPSGDDDSSQQTTAKPSGGIPAANIFDEASTRAGFKLIDPIQQKRFAGILKMKKLIEESGLEEPETATDATQLGTGDILTNPVDITDPNFEKAAGSIKRFKDAVDSEGNKMFSVDDIIDSKQDVGNIKNLSDQEIRSIFDQVRLPQENTINQAFPIMAAEGGIMDLGRQELFLGGIAKGLKKAAKGISRTLKKVAKSPVGKAALLYGLASVGGSFGAGKGLFSKGMFNPGNIGRGLFGITAKGQAARGFPELAAQKGLFGKLGLTEGYGAIMPTIKGGITLASILPLLVGKTEEEKKNILDEYYASQQLNPSLSIRGMGGDTNFDFYGARTQAVADGGRIGYQEGSKEPVAKKTMPLLDMDGQEMDLRAEGGFVPIGRMEKADDVPARLSKNEFVFTADAVRNAGDGDVDKGAEVMYNMMKNLEDGGNVSDESQGLEGAREMFQTSKRLEEVL